MPHITHPSIERYLTARQGGYHLSNCPVCSYITDKMMYYGYVYKCVNCGIYIMFVPKDCKIKHILPRRTEDYYIKRLSYASIAKDSEEVKQFIKEKRKKIREDKERERKRQEMHIDFISL